MCLEGLDGAFSRIGAVDIGRYELEGGVPVLSNAVAVGFSGFIVKDLVLKNMAFVAEAGHDAGIGSNAMAVVARLKGFHKYGVAVAVVGQHDVLVAAARACGEATHAVRVEFADGCGGYVELV